MPFDRSREKLEAVIQRVATEDPDVREGLIRTRDEGEIPSEVADEADRIWEVTLDEVREFNQREQDLQQLQARLASELGPGPGNEPSLVSSDWVVGITVLYFLGLLVTGIVFVVRDASAALSSLMTVQGWSWIAVAVGPFLVLAGISARLLRGRSATHSAEQDVWRELTDKQQAKRRELELVLGVPTAVDDLNRLRQKIEQLLHDRVKQALVSAINKRTDASYATTLYLTKPRGFGEVFDKRLTIVTPARKRVEFLLRNMPGGSIGIAGSRGAGKTTLLKCFCGQKGVLETLKGKPVLGTLVSAPVAYDARDFILYLFSSVCQTVIEKEGGKPYEFPSAPRDEPPVALLNTPMLAALRPVPRLAIRGGLVLIASSLLLALGLAALPSADSNAQAATRQSSSSSAAQGSRPAGDTALSTAPPAAEPLVVRWVRQLKIEPGSVLVWGLFLVIGGVMLASLLQLHPWLQVKIGAARLLHGTLGLIPPYAGFTRALLDRQLKQAELEALDAKAIVAEASASSPPKDSLWDIAQERLRAIKFQQSYTTGWSGSLSLPIGVEGGVNRAVTLAQNQLSLPEVVQLLTKFLEKVSDTYQVIIGIDELDKIPSDEQAQRFLNDIKSVFGLERCFYLISVSEDAMSNFERRGLPFRDVFDSSFDEFVYVEHLDFAAAQELLEQRIVGRPVPFFGLSYCMSGGLPRDLIRSFRSVLEFKESFPSKSSLSAICQSLVTSDLLGKVRAIRTSARKIALEPDVDELDELLHKIETVAVHDIQLALVVKNLLTLAARSANAGAAHAAQPVVAGGAAPGMLFDYSDLATVKSATQTKDDEDKKRAALREQLDALADEMGTYVCYAATLRHFFTDTLKDLQLTRPQPGGELDTLATARRLLGANPRITRRILEDFRHAQSLPLFP